MWKAKEKANKISGITLVALVVTIVVLLILAGITVMYVMGDNGVFGKASKAKEQTELGKIEEQAGIIYSDKWLEKVSSNLNDKPTMQEIVDELKKQGEEIKQVEAVSGNAVTGISLDKESMSLNFGKTNTIKVTILSASEEVYTYYAIVDGKYYKMHYNGGNITIDRTASDISNTGNTTPPTLEVKSSDETVATVAANTDTNIITITAKEKEAVATITVTYGTYTKTCTVEVTQESDWAKIAKIAKEIAEGRTTETVNSSSTQATVTVDGNQETIEVGQEFYVKHDGILRKVRLIGFKQDDLVDQTVYGGNHEKASLTFEFMDCLGTHSMNGNATNVSTTTNSNGWAATEMRKWLNGYTSNEAVQNVGINGIAKTLADNMGDNKENSGYKYIKQVKKQYIKTYNDASSNMENGEKLCSYDYLWLLAASEIFATGYQTNAHAYAIATEGVQYKYFADLNPTWNDSTNGNPELVNKHAGAASDWWLRSPQKHNLNSFCCVNGSRPRRHL